MSYIVLARKYRPQSLKEDMLRSYNGNSPKRFSTNRLAKPIYLRTYMCGEDFLARILAKSFKLRKWTN
jgi:hypothetical protein